MTNPVYVQQIIQGNGTMRACVMQGGIPTGCIPGPDPIGVLPGTQVQFQATPGAGAQFVKFVSASGVETTQNPFTTTVNAAGSITAVFSGGSGSSSSTSKLLIGAGLLLGLLYFLGKRR